MGRTITLCVTAVFAAGCQDVGFWFSDRPDPTLTPVIGVAPDTLAFGDVGRDAPGRQVFTVANHGGATLEVDELAFSEALVFHRIDEAIELPLSLRQGEVIEVPVWFEPTTAGRFDGELLVHSNDPVEPVVVLPVTGTGRMPSVQILPDPLDFVEPCGGLCSVGCGYGDTFVVRNNGFDPVVIHDWGFVDAPAALEESVDYPGYVTVDALPLQLDPEEAVYLGVYLEPMAIEEGLGTFEVVFGPDDTVVQASIDAPLVYPVEQVFEITGDPLPLSILVAVDQSGSMDSEAAILADEFDDFITEIGDVTDNWRIGVVTEDDGCFVDDLILTASTPDYETEFADAVVHGDDEALSEKLFLMAQRALGLTEAGECNHGFLEDGAPVHLIVVSDEPEQSNTSWQSYQTILTDAVTDRAGADASLTVHAIVDVSDSCGFGGADDYLELANATGGEVLDICSSSWGADVSDIAEAAVASLGYRLDEVPIDGSLEVRVDGVLLDESEYSLDESGVVLSLESDYSAGAELTVSYGAQTFCADPWWPAFPEL